MIMLLCVEKPGGVILRKKQAVGIHKNIGRVELLLTAHYPGRQAFPPYRGEKPAKIMAT